MFFLTLLALATSATVVSCDVDSGCPSWGCLPGGTFAFSAGVPRGNGGLTWSTQIDHINGSVDALNVQGCVSDQEAVVCATTSGYVSLDPTDGTVNWKYTTKTAPYLPVMDIFGDVIGMDTENLYSVGNDGTPQQPISISILQPAFSLMVANDSILFLTSTSTDTAQVVSYGTDGIVDGAITLTGELQRVNGTFVPCSQPVISGFRVYLLTQFVPTDLTSERAKLVLGMQRLYAMDLRRRIADRIQVMWYFNLEMEKQPSVPDHRQESNNKQDAFSGLQPIVMYYRGIVYINNAGPQAGDTNINQPYASTLWAFRDLDTSATLLYRKPCFYGQLAAYDTYEKPLSHGAAKQKTKSLLYQKRSGSEPSRFAATGSEKDASFEKADEDGVIWILNRSPAMLAAHSAKNGTTLQTFNVASVTNVTGWASSMMGVTRQSRDATTNVVVVGMQSSEGEAYLVAMEADPLRNITATPVFKVKVSGSSLREVARESQPRTSSTTTSQTDSGNMKGPEETSASVTSMKGGSSRFTVAGQVINIAVQTNTDKLLRAPNTRGRSVRQMKNVDGVMQHQNGVRSMRQQGGWSLGVVALVTEVGPDGSKLHAVSVF